MKIGVVREGKVPPDQRVPRTPAQCAELKRLYPEVELVVESSDVRRITDDEYRAEGIDVVQELDGCDVLLGVKEVPVEFPRTGARERGPRSGGGHQPPASPVFAEGCRPEGSLRSTGRCGAMRRDEMG